MLDESQSSKQILDESDQQVQSFANEIKPLAKSVSKNESGFSENSRDMMTTTLEHLRK